MPTGQPNFEVLVCGDYGEQSFIHRSRDRESTAQADSGAAMLKLTLDHLLDPKEVKIHQWLPKHPTISPTTLWLEERPASIDGVKEERSKLRIVRATRGQAPDGSALDLTGPDGDVLSLSPDIAVIHDAGGNWRSRVDKETLVAVLRRVCKRQRVARPIIVHLCATLPEVTRTARSMSTRFVDTLWQALDDQEIRPSVQVILSITPIRSAGAAISRRLSWEQTIEDLAADLLLFDQLRALSRFGRLTVRFGHAAAVHLDVGGRLRRGTLIFAPEVRDGIHRDPAEDGRVVGKNALVIAAIVSELSRPGRIPTDDTASYVQSIQRGMRAAMELFDRGYPSPADCKLRNEIYKNIWATRQVLNAELTVGAEGEERHKHFVVTNIPCSVLRRPPGITGHRSTWEILRDQIDCDLMDGASPPPEAASASIPGCQEASQTSRIGIGAAIALYGSDRVLNRQFDRPADVAGGPNAGMLKVLLRPSCRVTAEEPGDHVTLPPGRAPLMPDADAPAPGRRVVRLDRLSINTPIAHFGKLVTVEREDIETFRSVQNLIKKYLHEYSVLRGQHHESELRPLSIAVFGPPGAGKSFAVKQIIGSINGPAHGRSGRSPRIEVLEANLSQFRGVDELEQLFIRVQRYRIKNKSLPLVFFDEFDTDHHGVRLGWLKHFLAPMQDASFVTPRETLTVGPAVFVFAGGVYAKFQDFDPSEPPGVQHSPPDSQDLRDRTREFRDRKGPDFVSRLRGHVNIHSVDAPDGYTKHIIRRALTLRGQLLSLGDSISTTPDGAVSIDHDIVYALLTIDRYRHGARSMEAILQMCTPVDGGIQKVSLPSRQQLNMHVDADEFFIRLHRGRYRPQMEIALPRMEAATGAVGNVEVHAPDVIPQAQADGPPHRENLETPVPKKKGPAKDRRPRGSNEADIIGQP
jgi:hypothetical protein